MAGARGREEGLLWRSGCGLTAGAGAGPSAGLSTVFQLWGQRWGGWAHILGGRQTWVCAVVLPFAIFVALDKSPPSPKDNSGPCLLGVEGNAS